VTELWRRYQAWLEQHMPDAYWDLGGPASPDVLTDSEELMGVRLPAALRESYRLHNGQRGQATGIVGNWRWLPLQEVVREWQLWNEMRRMGAFAEWNARPDLGIQPDWWNEGWIPFTADGNGNHHCLDLNPDTKQRGQLGQIIVVYSDSEMREVLAPSFEAWLEEIVAGLEGGRFPIAVTEEGSRFLIEGLIEP